MRQRQRNAGRDRETERNSTLVLLIPADDPTYTWRTPIRGSNSSKQDTRKKQNAMLAHLNSTLLAVDSGSVGDPGVAQRCHSDGRPSQLWAAGDGTESWGWRGPARDAFHGSCRHTNWHYTLGIPFTGTADKRTKTINWGYFSQELQTHNWHHRQGIPFLGAADTQTDNIHWGYLS